MEKLTSREKSIRQETGPSPYYVSSNDWESVVKIITSLNIGYERVDVVANELKMRRVEGDFVFFVLNSSGYDNVKEFRQKVKDFGTRMHNMGIRVSLLRG